MDGEDLGAQDCKGAEGCIRDGEWPDLPHSPVEKCQGKFEKKIYLRNI